jgi:predicted hydrocarbon binding protein
LGHELGTIISVKQVKDVSDIPEALKNIVAEYNIGDITITESTSEIIQLKLQGHSSIRDLLNKGIKTKGSFSSFEAGMLAGIVEKMTNIHCFAQELSSALEMGKDYCEFMIVFQKD